MTEQADFVVVVRSEQRHDNPCGYLMVGGDVGLHRCWQWRRAANTCASSIDEVIEMEMDGTRLQMPLAGCQRDLDVSPDTISHLLTFSFETLDVTTKQYLSMIILIKT